MPTIRHVQQLIQHGDYTFSIDLQDAYLHIPIVKHHHHFLCFVGYNVPYQWKVLPFGLATAPHVFTALTKPILFLYHCKGFHIVICLDEILVLACSKQAGRMAHSFLCSLLVRLGFASLRLFCFMGLCWDTVHMSVSLPPDKLADIQQLTLSLLQSQHVTVCWVMSFLGKANLCTNGHSQLLHLCHVIQSDMLHVYHSPTHLFSWVHFSLSSLHQLEQVISIATEPSSFAIFLFLMWLLLLMPCPLIGPFIFRDLDYLYQLVDPGQVLCSWLILPCRSFRPLP